MSKIEVFTGSCHLCDSAVALVHEIAEPAGHEVVVLSIDGSEAREYGLTSVPSIVRDGEVVFTGLPSREEAARKLGR